MSIGIHFYKKVSSKNTDKSSEKQSWEEMIVKGKKVFCASIAMAMAFIMTTPVLAANTTDTRLPEEFVG